MSGSSKEVVFDFRTGLALLRSKIPIVVGSMVLGAVVGIASIFVLHREYEATARFLPVSSGSTVSSSDLIRGITAGGLGGLGSLLPSLASSEIYPDLLNSTDILRRALNRRIYQGTAGSKSFREAFGFSEPDSAKSTERAINWARDRVRVDINKSNGIVTITFSNQDATIAASFVSSLLDCLAEFNSTTRQSQARSVRLFLEERITTARGELAAAEDRLAAFRVANVRFTSAPRLVVEEGRLERQVRIAEAVFQTLTQNYEMARVDEARDTPTITVIDGPEVPRLPAGLGTAHRGLLLAAIFGVFTIIWTVRSAWNLWEM